MKRGELRTTELANGLQQGIDVEAGPVAASAA
jgi:hypothetical protein